MWIRIYNAGKCFMLNRCTLVGWELRPRSETLGAICVDNQPAQRNCSGVLQCGSGFFPYYLRIFKSNIWYPVKLFIIFLFLSNILNGMLPGILTSVVNGVRAHRQFIVEFESHGSSSWVLMRTWRSTEFVRVAVAIIDRYYVDPSSDLAILGRSFHAIGSGASLISLSGM